MVAKLVETKMEDGLVILMLNNPPNNLLNNEFLDSIHKNIINSESSGARALLFISKLKHFSAGADPEFLSRSRSNEDPMKLINIIENAKMPTVAAINGAALGGGFELAIGCDFIIAADTSKIGLVESSVGLMPLAGGVQRLVERIGMVRAKEMSMFGRRYDAKTLEKWGLINIVVPEIQLHDSALSFAKQLASGPTIALREIKRIANFSSKYGIKRADKEMETSINKVLNSSDAKAGISYLSDKNQNIIFKGK